MTDQEIEKLREKLGSDYSVKRQNGAITVELVDIWKGVEFAECITDAFTAYTEGKIYPVTGIHDGFIKTEHDDFFSATNGLTPKHFKPSTKSAYVEQLKAKAKELYGEIKTGDKFSRSFHSKYNKHLNIVLEEVGEFEYDKVYDVLIIGGCWIYCKGVWAKRIEEPIRVKVELMQTDSLCRTVLRFSSNRAVEIKDQWEFFNHIEEAIESYLNKQ